MKTIDILKKALCEAENGILASTFKVDSHSLPLVFNGNLDYTGDSKITLELKMSMPEVIMHYTSEQEFSALTEDQFNGAAKKIQAALEDVQTEFQLLLKNKLKSYGLKEGDNHG